MGTGWGAKRGAEGIGFERLFLLVSLLVEGEAKENGLGLHSASPDCSREGLQATAPGWSWLISTNQISNPIFGIS